MQPQPSTTPPRTARRRLVADRLARWSVTGGGMAIIASILGILLFIFVEVAPLFGGADVTLEERVALPPEAAFALVSDEYREKVAVLGADGTVRVVNRADGTVEVEKPLFELFETIENPPRLVAFRSPQGDSVLTAATDGGGVLAVVLDWTLSYEGDVRAVQAEIGDPVLFEIDPAGETLGPFAARAGGDTDGAIGVTSSGELILTRRQVEENPFSGEKTESWTRDTLVSPGSIRSLVLDQELGTLFAGLEDGRLGRWNLSRTDAPPELVGGGAAVTALGLLLGDQSLVVGREDGALEIWFSVRQPDESFRLTRIRDFPAHSSPIRAIAPSRRNKGFIALDDAGGLGLYYSTSKKVVWRGETQANPESIFFTPKSDGLLMACNDTIESFAIGNPHPEVSLRAFFGKVWYEGYEKPEFVWQSSGGSDDFEPKLSLTPLMIGTLKGTIYSLLLAIPLGVLGAMYTAHFMHPSLKRFVKPTVEIMAALPSVVLGFLAGLWLAPRVEQMLPAMILMAVLLPTLVVAGGLGWRSVPLGVRGRFVPGSEVFLYMILVAGGIGLCLALNEPLQQALFGGSVPNWLMETTGLRYDQRNAIVVGLAMGLAVIPIIFSIAEDAFSNVPSNLVSGSLALGANRWQTVTRVVLPTASPGIFSAIMIGFGRAVGETMIVLMATGNTPVLDWNPFNGFRTLSANIAVEIPEAPQGDTLYRTLFLAALILFIFTFLINTGAELIRLRLRKRYAEL